MKRGVLMPKSYYPDRLCACGCNGKIEIKKSHGSNYIPNYIFHMHYSRTISHS
jgi:hypothetical protein